MQGVLNPERITVNGDACACDSPLRNYSKNECGDCGCACDSPLRNYSKNECGDCGCACDSPLRNYSKNECGDCSCSCDAPATRGAFQDPVSFVSYALIHSSQFTDTPTQPQPQKISSEFIPVKSIPAFSPNASHLTLYPVLVPVAGASCWKALSAWFHLTDRCNLRCDYCYLPHRPQDMSVETGRAAVHALFRSAQSHAYTGVKIMYAGGEPLLRFPLILELHGYAQQLAEAQSIYLDEVVLSNGTLLTPEMVQALKTRGIRLMISLDGLGTGHDAQRHFADGKGSFEKVSQAVELALEH
ncbi:radical SAM protein, partial [Anaerolinea sp.]|uniref:radical SAM protein n=1 Tax=Anaerolinea sp. TaxID=1872519 RepID=UPI002ACD38A2